MNYLENQAFREAFLDELQKCAHLIDLEPGRVLNDAEIDFLLKQAGFADAVRKIIPQSATSRFMQAAKTQGLGDTAQKALKASKPSSRMTQWGGNMMATPAQRLQQAGHNVPAGQAKGITAAVNRMGGASPAKRIVGGAVHGAGHHVGHKSTLGLMANPLGIPLGGAIEGATRQGGKELASKGFQRAGGALQSHAGKIGLGGEIAGLAGIGTAINMPVSAAGAVGTAALKGIGAKSGLISALGHYGAHGAADALGTAVNSGAGRVVGRGLKALSRFQPA
jgi:hypothetical protein